MLLASEKQTLLHNMVDLLCEYDYDYEYYALNAIIDEWDCQKAGLIEAFKKHPNYIEGKFMIAFDTDYERKVDAIVSYRFGQWIINNAMYERKYQYPEIFKGEVDYYFGLPYKVYAFFNYLNNFAERCVSEGTAEYLSEVFTELKFHAGQKTSRTVNKICQYLGLDKAEGYNREFAKYADSLSPMTIKRHTILSINPLDYLTMSFGNSWASCHTIDKENKRDMPNDYSGCYSSGTISYMLDKTSMVLYTVDASYDGDEYWNEPKINRQMFHYGEEKLVQGRLYPQDNDGCEGEYSSYRNVVQNIISTIFEFPNLWTLSKGTKEAGRYVFSEGTHYRDYHYYGNCTLSRIKGSENDRCMTIGAAPICISCGTRHNYQENINHCADGSYICADCGNRIDDEDDVVWIDGESYCRDCCHYCEYCNEYHRDHETYVRGYGYVCDGCLERWFYYCECCDTYVQEDDVYYVDCEDRYVCDRCLSEYYTRCEDCDGYFPNDEIQYYGDIALCEDCYDERTENEDEVC